MSASEFSDPMYPDGAVAFPPGMGPEDVYGRRVLAFLIDSLIIGAVTSVAITPFILATMPDPSKPPSFGELTGRLTSQFGIQLLVWIATIAYFYVCESRWNGQTVGKRAMRVRVVMADGSPVTRNAALRRSLMRVVDEMVCSFLVGLIASLTNSSRMRLGDRVAHTVVVDASVAGPGGGIAGQAPFGEAPFDRPPAEPPPTPPNRPPGEGLPGESNPWGSG